MATQDMLPAMLLFSLQCHRCSGFGSTWTIAPWADVAGKPCTLCSDTSGAVMGCLFCMLVRPGCVESDSLALLVRPAMAAGRDKPLQSKF